MTTERQDVQNKLTEAVYSLMDAAGELVGLMNKLNADVADVSNDAYSALTRMVEELSQHYDIGSMLDDIASAKAEAQNDD